MSLHGARWIMPAAILAFLGGTEAGAADPIGLVKTLSGSAMLERGGVTSALQVGSDVLTDDVLLTGPDSTIGVTFRDDTTLSMGPRGRLVLDSFAFDPAGENLEMGLGLMRGTFSVVSGQIAKLAPERVAVRTPTMTIGVRGTSFLVEVEGDE